MPETLRTERAGRVLTVRIDNPPHNFMNRHMVRELIELTDSMDEDPSIGAVVITGATDDLFITHYDVEEILAGSEAMDMEVAPGIAGATLRAVGTVSRIPGGRSAVGRTPARGVLELRSIHELFIRWNRMDKIFIAAISGPATGGGCELALACDLRYMAAEAPGIGQPELLVGFPPGAGGTQRLTRAVGTSRAMELMLEAGPISPQRALEIGLVHAVFPSAELVAEATATAARLARRAPDSVEGLKRAVYDGASRSLAEGLAIERKWFLSTASRPAARRAMRAYVDEVQSAQSPPFADPERLRRWQGGTAVDMVGD
jgi:enoyl-CoA hydratase